MDLISTFEQYVKNCIDAKGIYPFPMIVRRQDDSIEIVALDIPPKDTFIAFWTEIGAKQAKEVILGLDRTTKEGQGTEFADVLTVIHWAENENEDWSKSFRIGVINYQNEPRIVRDIDWNNKFWTETMTREAKTSRPPFRIKCVKTGEKEMSQ